jgi:hypothetical protein
MHSADFRAAKAIVDARQHEAAQLAEARLLYQQFANLPPAWLPRPGCWLLCRLGNVLVALGNRLQQYGITQQPRELTSTASSMG